MNKIEDFKLTCDFCGHKKAFKKMDQLPLRIDKNTKYQVSFAMICVDCSRDNLKTTLNGQHVRVFTERSRKEDDQSVFDAEDNANI